MINKIKVGTEEKCMKHRECEKTEINMDNNKIIVYSGKWDICKIFPCHLYILNSLKYVCFTYFVCIIKAVG